MLKLLHFQLLLSEQAKKVETINFGEDKAILPYERLSLYIDSQIRNLSSD